MLSCEKHLLVVEGECKKNWIILLLSIGSVPAEEIFSNEFEILAAIRVNTFELKDPHLFIKFFGS